MIGLLLGVTLPFLLLCFLSHLLYCSYRLTGKAGLTRLMQDDHGHDLPRKSKLQQWAPRWSRLESTFLLLGVLCQLGASISVGILVASLPWQSGVLLIGGFFLAYLLLVKLLAPAIANANADRISLTSLSIARPIAFLLCPVALGVDAIRRGLRRWLKPDEFTDHRPTAEDEILSIAEQSDDGDLEDDERAMIKSALEFGDTVTREIMTPRVDIVSLDANLPIAEAAKEISAANFSRFPVYQETIDAIVGLVHIKDLLRYLTSGQQTTTPIGDLAVEVSFIPEHMHIDDLLRQLQREESQCAIVVDEYGGTSGLVSVEDILEELVGEIRDRYDVERDAIIQADGRILVNARADIGEVNAELGLELTDGEDYDSIGGYVLHALGRIPEPLEEFEVVPGLVIRVLESTPRQITTVEILRSEPEEVDKPEKTIPIELLETKGPDLDVGLSPLGQPQAEHTGSQPR